MDIKLPHTNRCHHCYKNTLIRMPDDQGPGGLDIRPVHWPTADRFTHKCVHCTLHFVESTGAQAFSVDLINEAAQKG